MDTNIDFYLSLGQKMIDILGEEGLYNHDCDAVSDLVSLPECTIETGASKIVIIPKDREFVIKIPFKGTRSTVDVCQFDNINPSTNKECKESCANCPFVIQNEDCIDFDNAQIGENYSWDYCAVEQHHYMMAFEEGLGDFFAETFPIGFYHDHPIYLQAKMDTIGESTSCSFSQDSKKFFIHNSNGVSMNSNIGATFVEYYGKERTQLLLEFLNKYQIGDLHSGNLGYLGNRPVFVDYSDFND